MILPFCEDELPGRDRAGRGGLSELELAFGVKVCEFDAAGLCSTGRGFGIGFLALETRGPPD